jgi:hypothetical protein
LKAHREHGHKHSCNLDFGFIKFVNHFPGFLSIHLHWGGGFAHTAQPQNYGIHVISKTIGNHRKRHTNDHVLEMSAQPMTMHA